MFEQVTQAAKRNQFFQTFPYALEISPQRDITLNESPARLFSFFFIVKILLFPLILWSTPTLILTLTLTEGNSIE